MQYILICCFIFLRLRNCSGSVSTLSEEAITLTAVFMWKKLSYLYPAVVTGEP